MALFHIQISLGSVVLLHWIWLRVQTEWTCICCIILGRLTSRKKKKTKHLYKILFKTEKRVSREYTLSTVASPIKRDVKMLCDCRLSQGIHKRSGFVLYLGRMICNKWFWPLWSAPFFHHRLADAIRRSILTLGVPSQGHMSWLEEKYYMSEPSGEATYLQYSDMSMLEFEKCYLSNSCRITK